MIWAVKEYVNSHGAFEEYQVDHSGSKVKGDCRDAKSGVGEKPREAGCEEPKQPTEGFGHMLSVRRVPWKV